MRTVGLFRRTAAKPRVEALKELIEASPGKRERERNWIRTASITRELVIYFEVLH